VKRAASYHIGESTAGAPDTHGSASDRAPPPARSHRRPCRAPRPASAKLARQPPWFARLRADVQPFPQNCQKTAGSASSPVTPSAVCYMLKQSSPAAYSLTMFACVHVGRVGSCQPGLADMRHRLTQPSLVAQLRIDRDESGAMPSAGVIERQRKSLTWFRRRNRRRGSPRVPHGSVFAGTRPGRRSLLDVVRSYVAVVFIATPAFPVAESSRSGRGRAQAGTDQLVDIASAKPQGSSNVDGRISRLLALSKRGKFPGRASANSCGVKSSSRNMRSSSPARNKTGGRPHGPTAPLIHWPSI